MPALRGSLLTKRATPINSDRFTDSDTPSSLSPEQEKFLQKLRDVASLPNKKGKTKKEQRLADASGLAKTLLELLPDSPVIATIYAELKGADKEVINQIRKLFEFTSKV